MEKNLFFSSSLSVQDNPDFGEERGYEREEPLVVVLHQKDPRIRREKSTEIASVTKITNKSETIPKQFLIARYDKVGHSRISSTIRLSYTKVRLN